MLKVDHCALFMKLMKRDVPSFKAPRHFGILVTKLLVVCEMEVCIFAIFLIRLWRQAGLCIVAASICHLRG